MNIRTTIYAPRVPAHLELGQTYELKGTNSFGGAIPRQIFIPLGQPRPAEMLSFDTVVCNAWVFCLCKGFDHLLDYHQVDFPLATINLKEHGTHDRHVERVRIDPADAFHMAVMRRWKEVVETSGRLW